MDELEMIIRNLDSEQKKILLHELEGACDEDYDQLIAAIKLIIE